MGEAGVDKWPAQDHPACPDLALGVTDSALQEDTEPAGPGWLPPDRPGLLFLSGLPAIPRADTRCHYSAPDTQVPAHLSISRSVSAVQDAAISVQAQRPSQLRRPPAALSGASSPRGQPRERLTLGVTQPEGDRVPPHPQGVQGYKTEPRPLEPWPRAPTRN